MNTDTVIEAKALMIQGTASSVGKSILVTALCRIFAQDGYSVAPFKAQNMALNSFVTLDGGEMGRSQVVQAQAAGIEPSVDMNPILLKPEAEARSQVVVLGRPWKTKSAREYYRDRDHLWRVVEGALKRLQKKHELIIIEGAGSPAEINLKKQEIVNMRVARHLQAPVLLVGDIDRGGVFAALVGTMMLLDREERKLVKGFLINKFRGDVKLLEPGLEMLAERTGRRPTLGVIPFLQNLRLAQEDSVFLDNHRDLGARGVVDIAVVRFPHISNYDDMDALAMEPGVSVRFIDRPEDLGHPEAIILPGSKTTLDDLRWLRHLALDVSIAALVAEGAHVVGLCGGYQMLGRTVRDARGIESSSAGGAGQPGLGLLAIDTEFKPEKTTRLIRGTVLGNSDLVEEMYGCRVEGYEIHMGVSRTLDGAKTLLQLEDGRRDGVVAAGGRVWGTYLHGIFDHPEFRRAWLRTLGWQGAGSGESLSVLREQELNRLADHVRAHIDQSLLCRIIGL